MEKLGKWPSDTYCLSWVSQRLANRAPDWTIARRYSWSVMQQLLNTISENIESDIKMLSEERQNLFPCSVNMSLADKAFYLNLGIGMSFREKNTDNGVIAYYPPSVYATIDNVEYELTIAKNNNIESLFYNAIPSRISIGDTSYQYNEIIPRVTIEELAKIEPGDIVVPGGLYISIYNNTTWEIEGRDKIYFPKVYITGVLSKGTRHTEVIPIRYNGMFASIYEWSIIESINTSYMDPTAEIEVKCAPCKFDIELDKRNIIVYPDGLESYRFLTLENNTSSSLLVSKGFTVQDEDAIRLGFENLDHYAKVEFRNDNNEPIFINHFCCKPNSDYIFAIDNDNLYVYPNRVPYPDIRVLDRENPDTKMDLYADRWIYSRDEVVTIKSDILDIMNVPYQYMWTLKKPNGDIVYLSLDGSESTEEIWNINTQWDRGMWTEQSVDILAGAPGSYVVSLYCLYSNISEANNTYTLVSRFLYYIPCICPEVTLSLPEQIRNSDGIMFDSNDKLWVLKDGIIYDVNVFYDYYIADYEQRTVWFRESYDKARVCV